MLHEKLDHDLRQMHEQMLLDGRLVPEEKLPQYYATFQERFGADQLRSLDGEALLELIHGRGTRDSLVYWLEFKNDDDFPGNEFGLISGGSALNYGIYRSSETGAWMSGTNQNQEHITTEQAVAFARQQRDQLLRGVDYLSRFPYNSSRVDYQQLQKLLDDVDPDNSGAMNVRNSAWAHKYFSLLFPDKLDDFHNPVYQRFHLVKLLQAAIPAAADGRYIAAGYFVDIARSLGMPINHLTGILNERNGKPHHYWRIAVVYPDSSEWADWSTMREGNFVGMGFSNLGDLSAIENTGQGKMGLQSRFSEKYPRLEARKLTQDIFNFAKRIEKGELVLVSEGAKVVGIGQVSGDYTYVPNLPAPHRLPVKWLSLDEWHLLQSESDLVQRGIVREIQLYANQVETERRVLEATPIVTPLPHSTMPHPIPSPNLAYGIQLDGLMGQIQATLERKRQVILYGPPGTGKTYWAVKTARELVAQMQFGQPYATLSPEQCAIIFGATGKYVRLCSFHPAYGYEDFLEGYRPLVVNNQMTFTRIDGIFKRLCDDAHTQPERNFYLIIDEINRGDIPRIFGELLTVLEKDKRDKAIVLPLSGTSFQIPNNVFVIGTMNTADRSIALLDAALRRRFGFIELMPDYSVLDHAIIGSIPLKPWLQALNGLILKHIGRDARNLQIGHAYFLEGEKPITEWQQFARVIREDIIPLLQEYCYEDYQMLVDILGKELIDAERQQIRHELFDPKQQDKLVQALLTIDTNITTSHAMTEEVPDDHIGERDDDQGT